jgi:hypothetical protein
MSEKEYKRPAEFVADARDGDGDGMVQDGTVHERPVADPVSTPEEEVVAESVVASEPAEADKSENKRVKSNTPSPKTQLSSGTVVHLSALDFASHARNSASVAAVQVRLIELGHYDAGSDKRGDIGEGTCKALCEFQKSKGLEGSCTDAHVVGALFEKTTIKVVN